MELADWQVVERQQVEVTQSFHRLQQRAVETAAILTNQILCPVLVVRGAAAQGVLPLPELLLERRVRLDKVMLVVVVQVMAVQITLVAVAVAREPQVVIQLLALMEAQGALVLQAVLRGLL